MKKNNITRRLSLRAKFKSMEQVEVVIMDEKNNVQIELIPIHLGVSDHTESDLSDQHENVKEKEGDK